jgi:hypothetical protein
VEERFILEKKVDTNVAIHLGLNMSRYASLYTDLKSSLIEELQGLAEAVRDKKRSMKSRIYEIDSDINIKQSEIVKIRKEFAPGSQLKDLTFSDWVSQLFGGGKKIREKRRKEKESVVEEAITILLSRKRSLKEEFTLYMKEQEHYLASTIQSSLSRSDQAEREAIELLEQSLKAASSLEHDAKETQRYMLGAEQDNRIEFEIGKRQLDALALLDKSSEVQSAESNGNQTSFKEIEYNTPADQVILAVRNLLSEVKPEAEKLDPYDFKWATLNVKDIEKIRNIPPDARLRAYRIWDEFIDLLNTLESNNAMDNYYKSGLEDSIFLGRVCKDCKFFHTDERQIARQRWVDLRITFRKLSAFNLESIDSMINTFEEEFEKYYRKSIGKLSLQELEGDLNKIGNSIYSRFGKPNNFSLEAEDKSYLARNRYGNEENL